MEEPPLDQKPRSVSDTPEKRVRPDQPHVRERSFTDIFSIFSKRQKALKIDASTNTTPLDEREIRARVPPPLPAKKNTYMYYTSIRPDVDANIERVYEEVSLKNMNIESNVWNVVQWPNQEMKRKENKDETDEDSEEEETSGDEAVYAMANTTIHQKNSHQRTESASAWSLGSFQIGPPVELMKEVLSGEQWAEFWGNGQNPFASFSAADLHESDSYVQVLEPDTETSNDAVDGRSAEEDTEAMKKILLSVKIIEEKEEAPKVSEEPEPPSLLPPKLCPSSSSALDRIFRSSIFYKLPPPGKELPMETPKSGRRALGKNKMKLRKSSAEDAQLNDTLKDGK